MGYMDAHGKLVRTLLREAYEHGGVFLLDEIDAGNPGVLTVLNALLANGQVGFPMAWLVNILILCAWPAQTHSG
jgi:cobaltochelatase CobS